MPSVEEMKTIVLSEMDKSDFIKNLDLEFDRFDEECAIGKIPFADKFLNPYGTMHGGLLYALADTVAGALACLSGTMCTTIDGNLHYLAPAAGTPYVYCKATRIRNGAHMVYVRVEIYGEDGRVYDDGSFNYFKIINN